MGACIGACAASMCCSCVSKMCGWSNAKSERFHKIPYTILIFFSLLVALLLKNYQGDFGIPIYGGISMHACDDSCKGDQAVYRITLALTLFFAAHAFLVTIVPYAFAKEIHTACFGVKVLLFIGMVIGVFYMENESLNQFADACRVISLIFLVFQSVVLIDYAYTLHFWMIDKEDTSWDIANLSMSGLMIAAVITAVGLMFHWFADGSSCGVEKFVLSMTIIVPFFYTVAACTDYIPHGALFPSACVTGYATYIAYTAMLSSTNRECNTLIDRSGGATQWELAIGIIIAVVSITFTTWNIGSQSSKLFGARGEDEKNDQIKMGDDYHDAGDANEKKDDEDEEEEEIVSEEEQAAKKCDWVVFHFLMTVASMYACMLLTSWSTNEYSSTEEQFSDPESFWVKVASQWLVMILYIWTLVAPILFPDRDFT